MAFVLSILVKVLVTALFRLNVVANAFARIIINSLIHSFHNNYSNDVDKVVRLKMFLIKWIEVGIRYRECSSNSP